MADNKKLSELTRTTSLTDSDEFVVVDKSATSGADASSTGRTSKIRFDDLKNQIGSQGQKGQKGQIGDSITGEKGQKGQPGDEGEKGPRGPEGNSTTGDKGPRGDDGDKGQKGQRGDSQKGDKGQKGDFQKGEKGQKGDFQKGQKGQQGTPSNIKGPKGPQGDKSTVKGPAGYPGRNNPHIGWRGSNALYDSANISFKKRSGSGGWSDSYMYTDVYYTSGCSLTFKPNATNVAFMFGLSSTTGRNNSNRYYNIDAGFYLQSNGTYDLRKAGPSVRSGGSYTKDTTFTVNYDGRRIRYYVDGKLLFTAMPVGNKADVTYFAYASIHTVNQWCVRNWSFEPMAMSGFDGQKGQKGQTGSPSTIKGPKGPQGNPSTIKGPKGPQGDKSTIKGPKGDSGSSPKFTFSNGVLTITS